MPRAETQPAGSSPSGRKAPDPRQIVTPDAFTVAPRLLGRPLAAPWRRATAMTVDGLLIALLSNATAVLLAFAAGFVLFRAAARSSRGGYVRKSLRLAYRSGGALTLFIAVLVAWGSITDAWESITDGEEPVVEEEPAEPGAAMLRSTAIPGTDLLRTATDVMTLREADSEQEAVDVTRRVVSQLQGLGLAEAEIEEILEDVAADADPEVLRAVRATADELEPSRVVQPVEAVRLDSLAFAYAAAASAADTFAAPALRAELVRSLAADTLATMARHIQRLEAREEELEQELAADGRTTGWAGIVDFLGATADDFGLGVGWAALYFTAFLVLWRGQTPGKRLLGIRVIRLSGDAVTWWNSFDRFGGYAAGLATGLLGYFQIFWDRNRQAVHDKISETVVVKG